MGSKDHPLRQEAHWKVVPRSLRNGFRLHQVGPRTHQQSGGRHGRLCQLHRHASPLGADRDGVQPGTLSDCQESAPFQDALIVNDFHEGSLLREALQGIPDNQWRPPPLDLLEVYAYPNSQLTEVAQQQGMRARRFTLTDGNLETRAGQLQLLKMVLIYRPKHLWVSPECGPWSSWNQFNSRRSLTGHEKVRQSQEEARVHLKLCNLLSKIQLSNNRRIHLESPWQALTWHQPELADLMRSARAIQLDQCMFGLRHPETKDPMQKRTRIQSSSSDLILALDHRLCNHRHEHKSIAGTCRFQGRSVRVSQFAGSYPRVFAKAIVKGLASSRGPPDALPVLHVHELEEPVMPPSKRARTNENTADNIDSTADNSGNPADSAMTPNDISEKWKPVFDMLQQE